MENRLPTYDEIADNYDLWVEYIDPETIMTRNQFYTLPLYTRKRLVEENIQLHDGSPNSAMKIYEFYDGDYRYFIYRFVSLDDACAFAIQEATKNPDLYNKGEHVVILVKAADESESREVSVDMPD